YVWCPPEASRSDDPIIVRRRKRRALRDWFTGAAPEPTVVFAFVITGRPIDSPLGEAHGELCVGIPPTFGFRMPISKVQRAAAIMERTRTVCESVERLVGICTEGKLSIINGLGITPRHGVRAGANPVGHPNFDGPKLPRYWC